MTLFPKFFLVLSAPTKSAAMYSRKIDFGLHQYKCREWKAIVLRTQMKKHNIVNIK
jgi:hypothetical protein